jgi:vacuolar protein sorting-associated protein 13A/C
MIDMYHFYLRQNQYRRLRIEAGILRTQNDNRARALLRFAETAILSEIRERNRRWSWAYFRGRRDDRRRYVQLFKFREASSAFATEVRVTLLASQMP